MVSSFSEACARVELLYIAAQSGIMSLRICTTLQEAKPWLRLPRRTEPRFFIRIGAQDSRLFSRTVGRCSADDWDGQMLHFGNLGYRVIAHDRRGHGRSDQTWDGNDMNTYADDLAELFEKLDLKDAILIGHSTGGGEVARYWAGTARNAFPRRR